MKRLLIGIYTIFSFNVCYADKFRLADKEPRFVQTTEQAISLLISDITSVNEYDRKFQRYVWIPEPSYENIAAVNYTVNLACSRSSMIIRPTMINGGQLLRWDLRKLAPEQDQLENIIRTWEKFQFEPYFHITRGPGDFLPTNAFQIESAIDDPLGTIRFKIGNELWFKDKSGNFYLFENGKWIDKNKPFGEIKEKISAYGAHCGIEQSVLMQGLMHTNASIVRYDYFISKALSALDGGLYYEFAGIERNPGGGKTSQQAFLESLGADEKVVQQLRSDQRVAMFRSNVTGKPRMIEVFQGSGIKPGAGTGLITITYDLADENIDQSSDPIRNLLQFKDDAREVIAEKQNGLHIFALFANDGSLQDAAPDNIVKDHTVPAPHTGRVQSAISCIRCHGPFDGLQPFQNDVKKMMNGLLDIYGDNNSKRTVPETLERLAGLYSGDLTKPMNRSKDDYNSAVFSATLGMNVPIVSSTVSDIYAEYNYKLVDAEVACRELGFDVPGKDAVKLFSSLIPMLPPDEIGIRPEDPIVAALKAGLKINRYQWEQIYADVAIRSYNISKKNREIKKFDLINR
jgi:hypothetical protein